MVQINLYLIEHLDSSNRSSTQPKIVDTEKFQSRY